MRPPELRDFPRSLDGGSWHVPRIVEVGGATWTTGTDLRTIVAFKGTVEGAEPLDAASLPAAGRETLNWLCTEPSEGRVEVSDLLTWSAGGWKPASGACGWESLGGYDAAPGQLLGRVVDRVRLTHLLCSWFEGGPVGLRLIADNFFLVHQGDRRAVLAAMRSGVECPTTFGGAS